MGYNGKVLASAREKLDKIKQNNLEEQKRRISVVYKKVPEIENIDYELRMQMLDLAKKTMFGNTSDIERIRTFNRALQDRRKILLNDNGFSDDYLDDIYSCPLCKDSGVYKSGVCTCLDKLYRSELTATLSGLLKDNGEDCFSNFRSSLYPEKNRRHMENIFSLCKEFAEYFPNVNNLIFSGEPGLGKTFLSGCIARDLAEKGYSVVYDTASSILGAYERRQFSRDVDYASANAAVKGAESCDLMILDDLGTEYTSPAVMSALYTLINTRITNEKPIIINTNLTMDGIKKRYSSAIASRLEGCFTTLKFEGNDIRKIMKQEGS